MVDNVHVVILNMDEVSFCFHLFIVPKNVVNQRSDFLKHAGFLLTLVELLQRPKQSFTYVDCAVYIFSNISCQTSSRFL